eukprot:4169290-Amphidinium_carterae.1
MTPSLLWCWCAHSGRARPSWNCGRVGRLRCGRVPSPERLPVAQARVHVLPWLPQVDYCEGVGSGKADG